MSKHMFVTFYLAFVASKSQSRDDSQNIFQNSIFSKKDFQHFKTIFNCYFFVMVLFIFWTKRFLGWLGISCNGNNEFCRESKFSIWQLFNNLAPIARFPPLSPNFGLYIPQTTPDFLNLITAFYLQLGILQFIIPV